MLHGVGPKSEARLKAALGLNRTVNVADFAYAPVDTVRAGRMRKVLGEQQLRVIDTNTVAMKHADPRLTVALQADLHRAVASAERALSGGTPNENAMAQSIRDTASSAAGRFGVVDGSIAFATAEERAAALAKGLVVRDGDFVLTKRGDNGGVAVVSVAPSESVRPRIVHTSDDEAKHALVFCANTSAKVSVIAYPTEPFYKTIALQTEAETAMNSVFDGPDRKANLARARSALDALRAYGGASAVVVDTLERLYVISAQYV